MPRGMQLTHGAQCDNLRHGDEAADPSSVEESEPGSEAIAGVERRSIKNLQFSPGLTTSS